MGSNENRHGNRKKASENWFEPEGKYRGRLRDGWSVEDSVLSNDDGVDPRMNRRRRKTGRWCRGVIGQRHQWELGKNKWRFQWLKCAECGKENIKLQSWMEQEWW